MAIKNKDGSNYGFSKPVPEMEQQTFWDNKEKVVMHNKFGEKTLRENFEVQGPPIIQKEIKIPDFTKIEKEETPEIKIVQAIEESKPKPLSSEVFEVWCLPCLNYTEEDDPLYGEKTARVNYGNKFVFRARILELEDLHIKFVTNPEDKIPVESVIYPKMRNRRWWRVKAEREIKGFNVYLGQISDYHPSFADSGEAS